jgi:hypothetical protein
MSRRLAGISCFLTLASCGYRPLESHLPDDSEAICIPLAENQTAFPGVAVALTKALRIKSQESGLRVVPSKDGVHRLRVRILHIEDKPGMLEVRNGHLDPLETVWYVRAEARLENPAGRVIRGPRLFEVGGRSYAGGNPAADESLGNSRRQALQDDLADTIIEYLFQQAWSEKSEE